MESDVLMIGLFIQLSHVSRGVHFLTESNNYLCTSTYALNRCKLWNSTFQNYSKKPLVVDHSNRKTSSAVLTESGEERQFKQIHQSVFRGANAFLASVKSSTYGFKLRVDLSGQSSSQTMKGLFKDNGIIGILEEAGMKRIDNVSLSIGLIFGRYCLEEDKSPVVKAFTA